MASVVTKLEVPSLRERVSDDEWNTRIELAAAYRLADMFGWQKTLIYNHISARVPGEDHHFLLNPFGLRYDEVTASNLVKIDLEGNILDDTPYGINQAGYTIHSAIHAAREDAICVIHTHTEAGIGVSCLEEGFMFVHQDALMFYDNMSYHEFEGIALDLEERERLVRDLGEKYAMILKSHGLLTCGRTIGEAFTLMYFLEKCCDAQLRMMATGGKLIELSDNVMAHTAGQFDIANTPMGGREWPAMMRMLDDKDPSYRQ